MNVKYTVMKCLQVRLVQSECGTTGKSHKGRGQACECHSDKGRDSGTDMTDGMGRRCGAAQGVSEGRQGLCGAPGNPQRGAVTPLAGSCTVLYKEGGKEGLGGPTAPPYTAPSLHVLPRLTKTWP